MCLKNTQCGDASNSDLHGSHVENRKKNEKKLRDICGNEQLFSGTLSQCQTYIMENDLFLSVLFLSVSVYLSVSFSLCACVYTWMGYMCICVNAYHSQRSPLSVVNSSGAIHLVFQDRVCHYS